MNQKTKLNKIRKIKNKINLVNELGGKCEICNEDNFVKLCFHHKNADEKKFEINDKSTFSFEILIEEARKCNLLCQNCHREIHYLPEKIEERRVDKKIYLEYAGGVCIKCGYNKCPAALTFHHRNPEEKEFWIGALSEKINSIYELSEKIRSEIDKCDLLCSNCHVMEHFDKDFYKQNKNLIDNYKIKRISSKIDRKKVFELKKDGYKNKDISKMLNCAKSTISDILNGKS